MEIKPQKPNISFEEFEKLDIRLCEIMTCQRIPNTKKLYKMEIRIHPPKDKVNLNDPLSVLGIRQVVSAIAESIAEEQLVGKCFPFILNLEPREIRGIRSEAMIILAESDGKFIPLSTDDLNSTGAILI